MTERALVLQAELRRTQPAVTSFADAEYHVVVDAIRRWRAFAMEMVQLFERQGGRSDPAYQGAIRMVVLADQVLRILGQTEP